MDAAGIVQIVQNCGFAVLVCVACFWYIKHREDANDATQKTIREEYSKELAALREEHKSETEKLTTAVQNNTLIITKLYEYLNSNL